MTGDNDVEPSLTIAIPLHESRRWVDVIAANVERIPYPRAEIIVSDRTCVDGTAEILHERLADDPRVRVIAAPDQLSWVEHYNSLIMRATGKYFMWMPHDDDFPAAYLPLLIDALEADEGALLAFGRLVPIDLEGRPLGSRWPVLPVGLDDHPWTPSSSMQLALSSAAGVPFRGLMRRRPLIEQGLLLRASKLDPGADHHWVLAVGLRGRLVQVPQAVSYKRMYPTSTHASWKLPPRPPLRYWVYLGVVWRYAPTVRDRSVGCAAVIAALLKVTVRNALRGLRRLTQYVRNHLQ